jgi:hypothetical protein
VYHQVVRNYRDENGKHHQEVLCHLGPHDSLSARRLWLLEQAKRYGERAALDKKRAKALKDRLLDLYGWEFVDGAIPSEAEAARELDWWWEEYDDLYRPDYYRTYSGTESMEAEEINIQLDKYIGCLDYYGAIRLAEMADRRADEIQARLDKLLRTQREYF